MPDMLDIWNVQLGWGNSRASGYGHCLNRKDSETWGSKKLVLRACWFCLGNKVPHSTFSLQMPLVLRARGFQSQMNAHKDDGRRTPPKKKLNCWNGKSPKLCLEMTKWWGRKQDFLFPTVEICEWLCCFPVFEDLGESTTSILSI